MHKKHAVNTLAFVLTNLTRIGKQSKIHAIHAKIQFKEKIITETYNTNNITENISVSLIILIIVIIADGVDTALSNQRLRLTLRPAPRCSVRSAGSVCGDETLVRMSESASNARSLSDEQIINRWGFDYYVFKALNAFRDADYTAFTHFTSIIESESESVYIRASASISISATPVRGH